MDAKELMIGDWVQSKANNGKSIYTRIVALDKRGTTKHIISTNKWIEDTAFEPILLTAEILEKNGFKNDELAVYRHIDEDGRIFVIYVLRNRGTLYIECSGYLPTIHYVHELQHALHLCGLNDLADNFKI